MRGKKEWGILKRGKGKESAKGAREDSGGTRVAFGQPSRSEVNGALGESTCTLSEDVCTSFSASEVVRVRVGIPVRCP